MCMCLEAGVASREFSPVTVKGETQLLSLCQRGLPYSSYGEVTFARLCFGTDS
jgi:hypothetical protein